jgi:hypothetical protein
MLHGRGQGNDCGLSLHREAKRVRYSLLFRFLLIFSFLPGHLRKESERNRKAKTPAVLVALTVISRD